MTKERFRYLAIIEYIGKNYSGFQVQPHKKTIQGEIEKSLKIRFSRDIKIHFTSRTDAGVNAKEHPIIFDIYQGIVPELLSYQLNSLLPEDIRIKSLKLVDKDWSLSYNLQAKLYVYRLYPYGKVSPFYRDFVWGRRMQFREGYKRELEEIIKLFERKADFRCFTTREDAENKDTVLEIESTSFLETEDGIWEFGFLGKRFLHKMIRMLVGAVVDCYYGKLNINKINSLLSGFSGDGFSPVAVPGKGLTLEKVFFKKEA